MRYVALLSAFVLAACSPATTRSVPQPTTAVSAPKDVVEFLLTSAANDFHTHAPGDPAGFRDVRIGRMTTANGVENYLLCGYFLPNGGGSAQWTLFVTIKTSGYEQYIGAQASNFCQGSSVFWNRNGDQSSALKSRLDSLR